MEMQELQKHFVLPSRVEPYFGFHVKCPILLSHFNRISFGFHVKCPILLSHFNRISSFWTDYLKSFPVPTSNFTKIRPVGAAPKHAGTRTDMTKLKRCLALFMLMILKKHFLNVRINAHSYSTIWIPLSGMNTVLEEDALSKYDRHAHCLCIRMHQQSYQRFLLTKLPFPRGHPTPN